jgi:preprotein translocase subunit SecA
MMAAGGTDTVVDEVQGQLEVLYEQVEQTLGEVFLETNETMPLISMVDNRLPRSVYRRIEEQLGLEKLEEIENIPLGKLSPDVLEIVRDAFVRWQESDLMLRVIDYLWTRHLTTMEQLRHSIGLQAYGQKDPLVQYKVKAYELFEDLKAEIRQLVVLNVLMMGGKAEEARAQIKRSQQQSMAEQQAAQQRAAQQAPRSAAPAGNGRLGGNGRQGGGAPGAKVKPGVGNQQRRGGAPTPVGVAPGGQRKIGRNEPCFCGSGKKYKHCHGR